MGIMEDIHTAMKYMSCGEYIKAEKIYKDVLNQDGNNAVVLSMLGGLYFNMRDFKQAKKYLEKSDSIKPLDATNEWLGLTYYCLGKFEKAQIYLEKAVDKTKNFDVFEKYIDCLEKKDDPKTAYIIAEKAYKMFPLKPEAIAQYADCCLSIGKFEDALNYSIQVTRNYPKYGIGWIVLGMVAELYLRDENLAKECYQTALRCGEKRKGNYNLALNALRNSDYQSAHKYLRKIYRGKDKDVWLNYIYACLYFKERKFKQAYKYYIYKEPQVGPKHPINKLKRPWDGKRYKDETLLVFCDQGYGDTFMFLRYIYSLKNKFKKVKILIRPEMAGIVERSFADLHWVQVCRLTKRFPSYDKSVILSYIPYYIKADIDTIPCSNGYFKADKKIVDKYKDKIHTDKLKIGICWESGGDGLRDMLHRTLNINMFEDLFKIKNSQFYSFQVKPAMDNYKDYSDLIDLAKDFENFDDTAGALCNMDLLITVDTAIAHLAGALGVKTYILLPYYPDWRWFDNEKKTEWYDSVTLFRQQDSKTWENVFENIKNEIIKIIS